MKKSLFIVFVNTSLFVIFLGFLEASVRFFYPQIQFPGTDSGLIKDNVYSFSPGLTPLSSGISKGALKNVGSLGFWSYSQQRDTTAILFLGDSVTMGIGVENDSTFTGRINNSRDGFQVLNPSLIGYSSSDYLNVIRTLFSEHQNSLNIKAVYLFWCLNDIYTNYGSNDAPGFESETVLGSIVSFFRSHFKLYHFLKNIFTDRPKAYYNFDQQFYEASNPEFIQANSNLTKIQSILSEKDVDFQIILLPYEFQLRKETKSVVFKPQTILSDSLENYGIQYYDLYEELYPYDSDYLYQYGDGIHFSDNGHRIVAEKLLRHFSFDY